MATDDKGGSKPDTISGEWARGRDVVEKCDERVDGVRKQGLAFVTGLLTAQSFLGFAFGKDFFAGSTGGPLAPELAVGLSYTVFVFSLVVILTCRFFEKQY